MMKVYFIVGPTASGKSEFAIEAAEKFNGVIVNADSLQFYQDLSIGSAAPTNLDFKKVPHYLFHCLSYPEEVTVGWFYRKVMETLNELKSQVVDHVFVVGGSGFYLDVLEKGLLPVGGENPELRSELESQIVIGKGDVLYQELVQLDPDWAKKIKPQDSYRLVRALEIIKTSGRTLTSLHQEWEVNRPKFPYPLVKLGLIGSKEWTLNRVKMRTHQMIQKGLISEVRPFYEKGITNWAPLKSVGYKETVQFLKGEIKSILELEEAIVKATMLLVKKQKTWFKRDRQVKWLFPEKAQLLSWALENRYFNANFEN
jgi:tRNA dimethylallyltransferase